MDGMKSVPLKRALFRYLCIALSIGLVLSGIIINVIQNYHNKILIKYVDRRNIKYLYSLLIDKEYDLDKFWLNINFKSNLDKLLITDFVLFESWTTWFISISFTAIAVLIFYRLKLKEPLRILKESSEKIANNDLDFTIKYKECDEMGSLCQSFEYMKNQLIENNKYLWSMIEEQRNLRAALAHDMRSPITVLKGYLEMLQDNVPNKKLEECQIMDMLNASYEQVERLNKFTDNMKQLSAFEHKKINYDTIIISNLIRQMENIAEILIKKSKLSFEIRKQATFPLMIIADQDVILEVYENIITNAMRYATNDIIIEIIYKEGELRIAILDDGKGFGEDINYVKEPFYHTNHGDDLSHFGLGLYISKLLCEKHGGNLLLYNKKYGGACVTAIFKMNC